MSHTLPELGYEYTALEPNVDAKTMEIHHSKHHQGYVNKLNAALEGHSDLADLPLNDLLSDLSLVPEDLRTAVRNNGGGHFNHSLFWTIMSPSPGEMSEELSTKINETFESLDNMKDAFNKAAATRFGSGWAWLSVSKHGDLVITSTANQDNPIMEGDTPILGLDVWEHAYYLNYQNKRPDYIAAWWNTVDFAKVSENYSNATSVIGTS